MVKQITLLFSLTIGVLASAQGNNRRKQKRSTSRNKTTRKALGSKGISCLERIKNRESKIENKEEANVR